MAVRCTDVAAAIINDVNCTAVYSAQFTEARRCLRSLHEVSNSDMKNLLTSLYFLKMAVV
jgi:hypothetical protein